MGAFRRTFEGFFEGVVLTSPKILRKLWEEYRRGWFWDPWKSPTQKHQGAALFAYRMISIEFGSCGMIWWEFGIWRDLEWDWWCILIEYTSPITNPHPITPSLINHHHPSHRRERWWLGIISTSTYHIKSHPSHHSPSPISHHHLHSLGDIITPSIIHTPSSLLLWEREFGWWMMMRWWWWVGLGLVLE